MIVPQVEPKDGKRKISLEAGLEICRIRRSFLNENALNLRLEIVIKGRYLIDERNQIVGNLLIGEQENLIL